jgi:hypothetical protein
MSGQKQSSKNDCKVVPFVWGDREHSETRPFCDDLSCPCHEDRDAIEKVNEQVQEGLLSKEDADRLYRGKLI